MEQNETKQENGKFKVSFGQNSKNEWNIKEVRVYSDDKEELKLDFDDLMDYAQKKLKEVF